MAILEIKGLHFTYPEAPAESLSGINLSVGQGEFVVICGSSGCGKTTLLRHIKQELKPVGRSAGSIIYANKPLHEHEPKWLSGQLAMVQQDPENQIVMEQVLQELAFGLENAGCSTPVMRRRIAEMTQVFGLEDWLYKKTYELSGGQKQMLNLAAVLLLRPKLLLLDEPTAQLDPVAAKQFLQMVHRLNEEFGMTVIMTEHRLDELFPLADRIVMMDKGAIKYEGTPSGVINQIGQVRDPLFWGYLPALSKLYLAAEANNGFQAATNVPLTIKEGRTWLSQFNKTEPMEKRQQMEEATSRQNRLLECKELQYQYDRASPVVLHRLDLTVYANDYLTILGGNGAGKSTLLQLMAGLLKPVRGKVLLSGQDIGMVKETVRHRTIGYLSQNPMSYFLHDTVHEELEYAAQRAKLSDPKQDIAKLVDLFELRHVLSKHPHDISGGERQKAALACILLARPELLLLDEPTKALDPHSKQAWGELLQTLHSQGLTIVIVTHDVEFAARYAARCAMLFDGMISSAGAPAPFFSENYFYTTVINRLVRDRYPEALTYEEVLTLWNVHG
ncbi:MAG: transporter ATP-binding protein [Paenibacillus sp.]|nr:transporter ATP-binding protein [Paenibacillus sp.]